MLYKSRLVIGRCQINAWDLGRYRAENGRTRAEKRRIRAEDSSIARDSYRDLKFEGTNQAESTRVCPTMAFKIIPKVSYLKQFKAI